MLRRKFIGLITGAATWPLEAIPVISSSDAEWPVEADMTAYP